MRTGIIIRRRAAFTSLLVCVISIFFQLAVSVTAVSANPAEAADGGGDPGGGYAGFTPMGRLPLLGSRVGSLSPADLEAEWEEIGRRIKPYIGTVIDSIVVTGNTRTRRETIVREMATRPGEDLDETTILRDASYLRGLGFFSVVEIDAESTSPGGCRVIVHIEERPGLFMKYPYPVLNYDLEKGLSYGLRWRVRNFRGRGEEITVYGIKRREKEHGGNICWNSPWFAGYRLRFSGELYTFRRLEEPVNEDFIKEQHGARIKIGFPLSDDLIRQVWLGVILSFEDRHSAQFLPSVDESERSLFRQKFASLGGSILYDSRDNNLTPSHGVYAGLSAVKSLSIRGYDQQYTSVGLFHHFYIPIGPAGTLILATDSSMRDGEVPWFYLLSLGGTSDLRGYDGGKRRGKAKTLTTLQWRRRVIGPLLFDIPHIGKFDLALNVVAFYDTGAIMESFDQLPEARFRGTWGGGIEILSPLQDLVRTELAVDEEGNVAYYWTSGMRF